MAKSIRVPGGRCSKTQIPRASVVSSYPKRSGIGCVASLRMGPDTGADEVDVGAMTVERQVELVRKHVADATEKGARIAAQYRGNCRSTRPIAKESSPAGNRPAPGPTVRQSSSHLPVPGDR